MKRLITHTKLSSNNKRENIIFLNKYTQWKNREQIVEGMHNLRLWYVFPQKLIWMGENNF